MNFSADRLEKSENVLPNIMLNSDSDFFFFLIQWHFKCLRFNLKAVFVWALFDHTCVIRSIDLSEQEVEFDIA